MSQQVGSAMIKIPTREGYSVQARRVRNPAGKSKGVKSMSTQIQEMRLCNRNLLAGGWLRSPGCGAPAYADRQTAMIVL